MTFQARSNLVFGYNLALDSRSSNLTEYEAGLSWEATPNVLLGLKHESTSKDTIQLGKVLLHLHHAATASQSLGAEFVLDY